MEKSQIFTPEGIKDLTAELEKLEAEKAEKNGHDADVAFLAERIAEIRHLLENAVVSRGNNRDGLIETGAVVKLKDTEFDEILQYQIVNRFEADPIACKISIESPIGEALAAKRAGQVIEVDGPGGPLAYEILSVEYRNHWE